MAARSRSGTTQPQVTHKCDYCAREFRREGTLESHVCEQRRRFQARKTPVVQMALQSFQRFYQMLQPSHSAKTWEDFDHSNYYNAFVRFAQYMVDVRCVNTVAYTEYLLKKNIKQDNWHRDSTYEQFLKYWVKVENPVDSLIRSLDTAQEWADKNGSVQTHYFRYAGDNQVCFDIVRGRMTAWCIMCSHTGQDWLAALPPHQLKIVYEWIDPDFWGKRLTETDDSEMIQETLDRLGM